MSGDSVIWRSEVESIMSACVALAHVGGVYTSEAKACAEAIAQALGVVLASPESWQVWRPGDDVVLSEEFLSSAKTRELGHGPGP